MAAIQTRQALTIAERLLKPPGFAGTDSAWRVLCDLYPAAETPDIIMAAIEYCTARRLDPFRKPVHIVAMYNSRVRRKVQVVMQGIAELETTAARSNEWVGADEPEWGQPETRIFRGEREENNQTVSVETKLTFPTSCKVAVYRFKHGKERRFAAEVFWIEAYGRAAFRSELPNERWSVAPRQMLSKCALAAALRMAFPEDVGGQYAAEEMEDKEIEDGPIIDGKAETASDTGTKQRSELTWSDDPLNEPNGTVWLKNFHAALQAATTLEELQRINQHPFTINALAKAPTLIKTQITDALNKAFERLAALADQQQGVNKRPTDPLAAALFDVERLTLPELEEIHNNAYWTSRLGELFPPDADQVHQLIEARKTELSRGSKS